MNTNHYTFAELAARAAAYFAANPEVNAFYATTHTGKFYAPHFESYARHAAEKEGADVVLIHRPADTLADAVAGAVCLPGFFTIAPALVQVVESKKAVFEAVIDVLSHEARVRAAIADKLAEAGVDSLPEVKPAPKPRAKKAAPKAAAKK